jgi:hypothetical protein
LIDSICLEKTDEDIRTALKNLPGDLPATFHRILQKVGPTGTRNQRKIFQFIVAALRPLTTDELSEALGVVIGDTTWNPSRFINIEATLNCCGSLTEIDEEERTVRFAHHSVKQFLIGSESEDGKSLSSDYPFDLEDARRQLSFTIVTYISYNVFETQLSRVAPKVPVMGAPSKIVDSIIGTSKSHSSAQLALRLLKFNKESAFDVGKVLSEAQKTHQQSTPSFLLLSYAKAYWDYHTSGCISWSFFHSPRVHQLWITQVDKSDYGRQPQASLNDFWRSQVSTHFDSTNKLPLGR